MWNFPTKSWFPLGLDIALKGASTKKHTDTYGTRDLKPAIWILLGLLYIDILWYNNKDYQLYIYVPWYNDIYNIRFCVPDFSQIFPDCPAWFSRRSYWILGIFTIQKDDMGITVGQNLEDKTSSHQTCPNFHEITIKSFWIPSIFRTCSWIDSYSIYHPIYPYEIPIFVISPPNCYLNPYDFTQFFWLLVTRWRVDRLEQNVFAIYFPQDAS